MGFSGIPGNELLRNAWAVQMDEYRALQIQSAKTYHGHDIPYPSKFNTVSYVMSLDIHLNIIWTAVQMQFTFSGRSVVLCFYVVKKMN